MTIAALTGIGSTVALAAFALYNVAVKGSYNPNITHNVSIEAGLKVASPEQPEDKKTVSRPEVVKDIKVAADVATEEEVELTVVYNNPAPRNAEEMARVEKTVAALRESTKGIDYERARYHPLHFKPQIGKASNEECLVCHEEILTSKPREISPAGLKASNTLAWYQTLDTYSGEQGTFHYRHLQSGFAKEVMKLSCSFCHKGNDPREETPDMQPGQKPLTASLKPDFTLRKMVNPAKICLRCHGSFPFENMDGVEGPWHEARVDIEDEETPNGCLTCHGEYGFRTIRHSVSYLNAANIEEAAQKGSDVCLGCHGGRQWYRITYPYPRTPWPDMDTEVTPDWAKDRPTQSEPEYRQKTVFTTKAGE